MKRLKLNIIVDELNGRCHTQWWENKSIKHRDQCEKGMLLSDPRIMHIAPPRWSIELR